MSTQERYTLLLRIYRRWHRYFGISLAVFLAISAITGILLSLKKEVDIIQPPTQKGVEKDLANWKSIDELALLAQTAFYKQHPDQEGNPINRIDVRPSKGMAKVLFKKGYWEVQIDGSNGQILSIAKRHSDWIEALHDGSIVSDIFKLLSMNILGFGLLLMIATGWWLWYGPRVIRKMRWTKKESTKESE
ncbi:MAG: PepSY-associated TM helix domain-containing protein [Bacteroidota bacterium]